MTYETTEEAYQALDAFVEHGRPEPLLRMLADRPWLRKVCEHQYPWQHRITDLNLGPELVRVWRCVECGEVLAFTSIEPSSLSTEAGVPRWLVGDALHRWALEERDRKRGIENTHWEIVRWQALREADIDAVMRALDDSGAQMEAIDVLGEMGVAATKSLPILSELLCEPGGWRRFKVGRAIWRISGDAATTLPPILETLRGSIQSLHTTHASLTPDSGFMQLIQRELQDSSAQTILKFLVEMADDARPARPELDAFRGMSLPRGLLELLDSTIERLDAI